MQCEHFVERLDTLLAGDLDAATRASLESHAAQCQRCGALLAAMQHGAASAQDARASSDTEAFVTRLLQHTSGTACGRAQTQLPEWVDGDLDADDRALVALHLEHCTGCEALAAVLRALRHDLPDLAFAEPGPTFTAAVVAATRTVRRPRRAARWQSFWEQLVGRPRLALEFATATCFVLMLLCALPFSPLRPLPQQALAVVRFDAVTLLQSAATQTGPVLRTTSARAWAHTGGRIESAATARWQTFTRQHTDTASWNAVRADLAEAGAGIRSGNLARLSHALHTLGIDLRRLFGDTPAGAPATSAGGST